MRAIFALSLIAAVFATSDKYYQSYYIFYKAPGCGVADVVGIETYDSFDYGVGTTCSDATVCSTHMTGSYEVYCTNGHPVNLGIRIWDIWTGTCSATMFPVYDYYSSGTNGVEIDDIYSYPLGCRLASWSPGTSSTYYDYGFTGATGTTIWVDGDCGSSNSSCGVPECSSYSPDYVTTTAGDACTTSSELVQPDTAATIPATKEELFVQDTSIYVYPCKSDGSCCVANGNDCCNPPGMFGLSDVQCCADNAAIANNTMNIKILNACLCDAEGAERGTFEQTTGLCTITSDATGTAALTEETAEEACDYAKVFAWCSVHALAGEFTEEALGEDAEPSADDYQDYLDDLADEETGFIAFPNTCQPGLAYGAAGVYTGAFGGNYGTLSDLCLSTVAGITFLGFECDAECSSGSSLAIAAIFALF